MTAKQNTETAEVAVIMGSDSDWKVMSDAVHTCEEFGVTCLRNVVSAHRTPDRMAEFGQQAREKGIKVIIAGAGGAAHLPGMVASYTTLPVIGVPMESRQLKGMDSLLSIVQMPRGVPVATVAINNASNAGLLAVRMLAMENETYARKLEEFRSRQHRESLKKDENLT